MEGFTWVTTSIANEKGHLIFIVDHSQKYTLSAALPEEYKANGWRFDGTDWYFFDEDSKLIKNDWIARDDSGNIWYYLDTNGKMVKDVTIDGHYIDENGEWKA